MYLGSLCNPFQLELSGFCCSHTIAASPFASYPTCQWQVWEYKSFHIDIKHWDIDLHYTYIYICICWILSQQNSIDIQHYEKHSPETRVFVGIYIYIWDRPFQGRIFHSGRNYNPWLMEVFWRFFFFYESHQPTAAGFSCWWYTNLTESNLNPWLYPNISQYINISINILSMK